MKEHLELAERQEWEDHRLDDVVESGCVCEVSPKMSGQECPVEEQTIDFVNQTAELP
jgi:hypothetical protein